MDSNLFPASPILIISPNTDELESYETILRINAITNIKICKDTKEALKILPVCEIGVILLDLSGQRYSLGEEFLLFSCEYYPHIPVVVITDPNEHEVTMKCLDAGAFDFIVKPMEVLKMVPCILRIIEYTNLKNENCALKSQILSGDTHKAVVNFPQIITNNSRMKSLFQYIQAVAPTSQPVLITGETGTGKELIARAIGSLSQRKGEFVTVNVAGLDDNMFSDTLFGHKKGAFTGADSVRKGLIGKAAGGTLFLDEIGDLSMLSQVKLLRLLQEGEYYSIGSDELKRSDARIIVATNKNLYDLQQKGKFRTDLYYRLNAHQVIIPPLRERPDDIPLLVDYFLNEASREFSCMKPQIDSEIISLLAGYHFPGNIRELRSIIYDAVSNVQSGKISIQAIQSHINQVRLCSDPPVKREQSSDLTVSAPLVISFDTFPSLKTAANYLVREAMEKARGNQSSAARLLGITQQALSSRLKNIGK